MNYLEEARAMITNGIVAYGQHFELLREEDIDAELMGTIAGALESIEALMPVLISMYEMTKKYYAYPFGMKTLPAKGSMTAEQATDSIVKDLMVRNLVFSNTVNKKFFDGVFCHCAFFHASTFSNLAPAATKTKVFHCKLNIERCH